MVSSVASGGSISHSMNLKSYRKGTLQGQKGRCLGKGLLPTQTWTDIQALTHPQLINALDWLQMVEGPGSQTKHLLQKGGEHQILEHCSETSIHSPSLPGSVSPEEASAGQGQSMNWLNLHKLGTNHLPFTGIPPYPALLEASLCLFTISNFTISPFPMLSKDFQELFLLIAVS